MTIPNLWNILNLEGSPFFQDRLDPEPEGRYPIELFVGRDAETNRILSGIGSSEHSRHAIHGRPGIGKTTLAQFIKSRAAQAAYVADAEAVAIGSADSAEHLLLRILAYTYKVVVSHGDVTTAELDAVKTTRQLVRAFRTHSGGFSIGLPGGPAVGATRGTQYVTPPTALAIMAPELLRDFIKVIRDHLGAEGIIIHLNNLENLSEADEERSGRILRDLRDSALMLPHFHYLFVGTERAIRTAVQSHAQIRTIVHVPPPLGALRIEQVLELLGERYRHLHLDRNKQLYPPVSDHAVREVYSLFGGDLRGTLRALEQASIELIGVAGERPTDPIQADDVRSVLREIYRTEMQGALSESGVDYLQRLAKDFPQETFTQGDLVDAWGVNQSTISDALNELMTNGYVSQEGLRDTKRPGRKPVEHTLAGPARLIFG